MNRAGARGGRMAGLVSTLLTTWRMSSEVRGETRTEDRGQSSLFSVELPYKLILIDCSKLYNSHVLQAIRSSLFCLSLQFECNNQQFSLNLLVKLGLKNE